MNTSKLEISKNNPKIFLSYAHEDINMAKRIYNDLKRYGLKIWFDQISILPGQNWEFEIEDAIENSDYFLALLSKNSLTKKGYVQKESKKALDILDLYPDSDIFIIPIRLEECNPINRKLRQRQWVDLFPENKYQEGIIKILKVLDSKALVLRSEQIELSEADVFEMIKKYDFYDQYKNPEGKGVPHKYKLHDIKGYKVIIDETTGLMWQQRGSYEWMSFEKAKIWIDKFNFNGYAGYHDWSIPTLEQAMSLIEPHPINSVHRMNSNLSIINKNLYISPIFHNNQEDIWTSDLNKRNLCAWQVCFYSGCCSYAIDNNDSRSYVRPVRVLI